MNEAVQYVHRVQHAEVAQLHVLLQILTHVRTAVQEEHLEERLDVDK